jgi:ATP-binding cassette subfamily B protein
VETEAPTTSPTHGPSRRPGWIRRLAAACWRHPVLVVLALSAAIVGTGLQAATPLLVRSVVDDAVAGDTTRLGVLVAALLGLSLLAFVISAANSPSTSSTTSAGTCSRPCPASTAAPRTL